jgi:hypothetical protein
MNAKAELADRLQYRAHLDMTRLAVAMNGEQFGCRAGPENQAPGIIAWV